MKLTNAKKAFLEQDLLEYECKKKGEEP